MNKLFNAFNRGFSLKSDDFRWIDDSVRLAMADIVKSMVGSSSCVLWGCGISISGTTATVTEGAIFHLDEVWHVPAHTFAVANPLPAPPNWAFRVYYDPAGVKTDKDLQSHDTYQVREVKGWGTGSSPSGTIDTVDVSTLSTLEDLLMGKLTGQITILPATPSITGNSTLLKIAGIVHISAELVVTLDSNSLDICTFPAGFRPLHAIVGVVKMNNAANNSSYYVGYELSTSGVFSAALIPGQAASSASMAVRFPFQSFIPA